MGPGRRSCLVLLAVAPALAAGCGPPDKGLFAWCSEGDAGAPPLSVVPSYHADVKPIVDGKCVRCHQPGGIGPFSLQSYDELFARRELAHAAVATRRMPPWLAAPCCAKYRADFSLTEEERAVFGAWVQAGAPAGDPAAPPARPTVSVGGLSRVDVTVTMPEPYTVTVRPGTTDDTRCFLIDWPLDREVFVVGASVVPGNRGIVHHLVMGMVAGDRLAEARGRDAKDRRPGFDCAGGTGAMRMSAVFGGGLAASEPPEGIGIKVPVGAKILLNIHYSTAHAHGLSLVDQTSVQFKLADSGRPVKGIIVANPAWLVGNAMLVRAGDPDAVYYYRYKPHVFTQRPARADLRRAPAHALLRQPVPAGDPAQGRHAGVPAGHPALDLRLGAAVLAADPGAARSRRPGVRRVPLRQLGGQPAPRRRRARQAARLRLGG